MYQKVTDLKKQVWKFKTKEYGNKGCGTYS